MQLNEYQQAASSTAIYPGRRSPLGMMYVALKMNGEAGEFAEHTGKALRDEGFGMPDSYKPGALREGDEGNGLSPMQGLTESRRAFLIKEAGDVLWYVSAACDEIGVQMEELQQFQFTEYLGEGTPEGVMVAALQLNIVTAAFAELVCEAREAGDSEHFGDDFREVLMAVLGWLRALAKELDVTFEEIAQANIDKLMSRKARGVLGGSGDNR